MMKEFIGYSIAPGIIAGNVTLVEGDIFTVSKGHIKDSEVEEHIISFQNAVSQSISEIDLLLTYLETRARDEREILQSHQEILKDQILFKDVAAIIREELKPADRAVQEYFNKMIDHLSDINDVVLSQRKEDFEDIKMRIIRNMHHQDIRINDLVKENKVVVLPEIIPSLVLSIKDSHPLAVIVEKGSPHSHSAIIAKSIGIPVVFNIENALKVFKEDDFVIVYGTEGKVILEPDKNQMIEYGSLQKKAEEEFKKKITLLKTPTFTKDKTKIELMGNIEFPEECEMPEVRYIDGVGLFRTEFLYFLDNSFPSAENQFKMYKQVIQNLPKGKPVYVRTFDVGGDKLQREFGLHKEVNPNLGCRGIRFLLKYKEIFRQQIRGILMASAYGNLKIMLPMISSIKEVIESHELISQVKALLTKEKIAFNKKIEVGIMIEIPSSAILADQFAEHVDFFSIGTNDLTQYVLAADRNNEALADEYTYYDPAVIELIKTTISAGQRNNIDVKLCGEMASDPVAVPLLLGLGLRSFSANIGGIIQVKKILSRFTIAELENFYKEHQNISQEELQQAYKQLIKQ
ncbi:MAG: phosphoenolpyruvate--protein phosphotransferase [Candidatus Celaenobacter antarcticus]|nr:phosphoenolpyruvate--protein phosphotransferase [Candidatus Celaenobacter antarcticus]